ncbi:MAG: hypothetical protein C4531_10270 [Desulfurivibrio sp.]|nr:MAG: hypothetical protein C4531_10270 [Desulfurivibrio sp.]
MEPYNQSHEKTRFVGIGILPVISYFGILWVISGFLATKKKVIEKGNIKKSGYNLKRVRYSFSNLSIWNRLFFLIAAAWMFISLIITDPWTHDSALPSLPKLPELPELPDFAPLRHSTYSNWDDFFIFGVLPIIFFGGILWVFQGFKRKNNKA